MWTYKQKKKFRYNLIYSTNKHVSTKNIEVVLQLRKQLTKHYQKQMFRKRKIDIAKFTILIASSIIRDDFSMSVCHVANVYHELHKHGKHSVYVPPIGCVVKLLLWITNYTTGIRILSQADLFVCMLGRLLSHFQFVRITVFVRRSVENTIVEMHIHFHWNGDYNKKTGSIITR